MSVCRKEYTRLGLLFFYWVLLGSVLGVGVLVQKSLNRKFVLKMQVFIFD